ncbi:MAG: DUF2520 domain-containing protein [Winkia neuii]|uniref:DUF2520 domain-containing protein n=1 Tax=Winkia neuii TaxID=33007 RepID=A0A2I1INN9_9ACTO|nr:DUF2520 domain-containing protein [Winkia neuii]OFJ71509.1 hypothetical protein HMPREF2851_06665 [Actinomyces sp. HMSC064C12]OFK01173.1 hypothetical protein HMPREF2835_10430 [Actinomyces sp. HMSC072A03]OFT55786.1 hypothetical protein HMPREF3152_03790 [Actinomyces sp. HMSC06A08]KWZ73149.1 hypothetical protein HMPREF3198_01507 [Winkia neuii]MDK8099026.1 DUF2520 domain-containing protein [Winkia neuii]
MNTAQSRLRVAVVGAGKAGCVLASALRASGHQIVGVTPASDMDRVEAMLPGVPVLDADKLVPTADLVLLTVPDELIGQVCTGLADLGVLKTGQLIVHAGMAGLSALSSAAPAGALPLAIHPVVSLTGTSIDLSRLQDRPIIVSAPAPLLPIAQALAVELGGNPIPVGEADRPLVAAALTHAGTHVRTVLAQAKALLAAGGIENPEAILDCLSEAPSSQRIAASEALEAINKAESAALALQMDPDNVELAPNMGGIAETYKLLSEQSAIRAN